MTEWLAGLRREHVSGALDEAVAHHDPFEQFRIWLGEAHAAGIQQPNAMTLSTADAQGQPDARIVLLKGLDDRGLVFFTHRTSRKGRQLADNPRVALTFFWDILERQVRVQGSVELTSETESDEYFLSRPRGSQLGAIVSSQSSVIADRDVLDRALADLEARVGEGPLERPRTWGGYRVIPVEFEFWQGRPNRLHDRIRYRPDGRGAWVRDRLAP